MSHVPSSETERRKREFLRKLGADEKRKVRSHQEKTGDLWSGLSFFGYVGWTVSIPTLLGAALGVWLDRSYPGKLSYTLALMIAGLTLGCFQAWRWLHEENSRIRQITETSQQSLSKRDEDG